MEAKAESFAFISLNDKKEAKKREPGFEISLCVFVFSLGEMQLRRSK